MEGWSEYPFCIDCCIAKRVKCILCKNVTTGDIFSEMSRVVIFMLWLTDLHAEVNAFMREQVYQLDIDGGMIRVPFLHWLLHCKKGGMHTLWKCNDRWHFQRNVTSGDIYAMVDWFVCWGECVHAWTSVSAGFRWRDDQSTLFALIVALQKGWNAYSVKMSRLVTFTAKCHDWWYLCYGWLICMLRWVRSCLNRCVSWIRMKGWSEYPFCIDCCIAKRVKCILCKNVTTGDIFSEMSRLVIFMLWLTDLYAEVSAFMREQVCQLDLDGGMIRVSFLHWLLHCKKGEMHTL